MDNAETGRPNPMEDAQTMCGAFGADYISLSDFTPDPTRNSLANASTQPRPLWANTQLAHLFTKPGERMGNSSKEETPLLNLPATLTPDIDVQMDDYNTDPPTQNPTIQGTVGRRLDEQLGPSGNDVKGSAPKLLLMSTPTLDASMETAAFVLDSSTSRVIFPHSPAHAAIEALAINRDLEQACQPTSSTTGPQPRRLAASDLMPVDKDRDISNLNPPTNFLRSPVEESPNPKWLKRTGLGRYTENLKDLSFSEFIALDDQGLRERGMNLQDAHNAQGHLASSYDNQQKGITCYNSMQLETG